LIDGMSFSLESLPDDVPFGDEPLFDDNLDEARDRLNNFRRLGTNPITDSVFYAWDETVTEFVAGVIDPGETTALRIVFRSYAETIDKFDDCTACLAGLMGFGDPIGGGQDDDGDVMNFRLARFDTSVIGDFAIEASFADAAPVPLPAGVWLMGVGVTGFATWSRKKTRSA